MTVAIVVLNWNNASDTAECLVSIMGLRRRDFIIYLVDNGSDDASKAVLEGHARALAATWGRTLVVGNGDRWSDLERSHAGGFVLLQNPLNLGYAGGNNIAIRRALADGCSGVWVLNNDTRVDPDALDAILEVATPNAGMVGLCVLDYAYPDRIQCVGGGFYDWRLTRARLNGAGLPSARIAEALGTSVDFITGSCMYLSRETLEAVGLLDERYFLYCEEIDFAERCRTQSRPMVIAPRGRVWHKLGSSTGSSESGAQRSPSSVFYSVRSRLLLTRKYRPTLVPVAFAMRTAYVLMLAVQGHPGLARAALRGVAFGLTGRPRPSGHFARGARSCDRSTRAR